MRLSTHIIDAKPEAPIESVVRGDGTWSAQRQDAYKGVSALESLLVASPRPGSSLIQYRSDHKSLYALSRLTLSSPLMPFEHHLFSSFNPDDNSSSETSFINSREELDIEPFSLGLKEVTEESTNDNRIREVRKGTIERIKAAGRAREESGKGIGGRSGPERKSSAAVGLSLHLDGIVVYRVKAYFANRPVKTALVIKSLFDRIESGYQFGVQVGSALTFSTSKASPYGNATFTRFRGLPTTLAEEGS
ncbi:hypothetical protein VNO77_50000 [Canavalia gladiata]|uniref:Uncharacterized protein n=1 Tax=Canavalia gladiata TaxID=3824 RepID=A0AAN9JF40_CANGL